jgi:phage N-6-adenine-methyltransferase
MANFFGKFNSNKQEWETPLSLFKKLDDEFHFNFDLAADNENKKCENFFNENDNALDKSWSGVCWLNPPYGNAEYKLENWIKKAFEETKHNDCVVVMLVPARTNTRWWHNYCMKSAEIKFICGRPKFGDAKHGLPQPLAVVVFKKHQGNTLFSSLFLA